VRGRLRRATLPAALLALGCAQAQKAPPAPAALPPPDSIAAVLAHRGELAIDDRQAAALLAIDQELQRQDAEARDRLAAPDPTSKTGSGRPSRRRGQGGAASGEPFRPEREDREEALAEAVAENDTRAFLRTEPIFQAEQWRRAREIAEQYRVGYSDRREALKRAAGGTRR